MTLHLRGEYFLVEIKKIYLGSTPVDKLLAGTNLIYEKNPIDTTPPVTTVYPSATYTYKAGQQVWLEVNESCITYYTLDGSTPTTASAVFREPFTINETTTIKYFSVDTSGNVETVKTTVFNIEVIAPSEGWRYLKMTPATMSGHWQCSEIRIYDVGFTNRALASTGTFTPVANNTSNFGSWAGLKNADTTTNAVYWTWGYPLTIDVDLGAIYNVAQVDVFLGTATTNPATAMDIRVSKNGTEWWVGKATYTGNPLTNMQRYTITT
jgi:Chitobiase/beta-hexosaminidase C-terminal domain